MYWRREARGIEGGGRGGGREEAIAGGDSNEWLHGSVSEQEETTEVNKNNIKSSSPVSPLFLCVCVSKFCLTHQKKPHFLKYKVGGEGGVSLQFVNN